MNSVLWSCTWTPQVETVLHDSSQGMVSLRTISDEHFQASHPVDIQRTTIERVLRGVYSFRDVRLIENLIGGDPKPVKLFSPSQVRFLAPLLSSAFSQATKEEEVFFQCSVNQNSSRPITGTLLIHNSTLFLTWKESLSKPAVLSKQHRSSSGLPNPSMPQDHTVVFAPKQALRTVDGSIRTYLKERGDNTLAIDYQLLAGLPSKDIGVTEGEKKARTTAAPEDQRKSGESPNAAVRTVEEPTTPDSIQGTHTNPASESMTDGQSDIRALKDQMEQLQREVIKQQEELERLKKEKP